MTDASTSSVEPIEIDNNDASDHEDNPWELVSGRKRHIVSESDSRKHMKVSDAIPTQNRFETLSNVKDDAPEINQQPVNIKPPPIHLSDVKHYSALVNYLCSETGPNSFTLKTTMRGVSVYPENAEVYRKLVASLRRCGADFHTYQLAEDKSPRVVIKNLHYATPIDIIKQELATRGYEATNVVNAISRYKKPLPMFFVDVTKATYNEKIFKIESLYYTQVVIEEPRKKRIIPQCMRCQKYGHTRTYCNHPPKCVRCGKGHDSTSCTKTRETDAICANCDGPHPANYRGCQTLKELRTTRKKHEILQRPPRVYTSPPTIQEFPPLCQPQQSEHLQSMPEQQHQWQPQQPVQNQQNRCTGMSRCNTQPAPPTETTSGELINLITGLNSIIQPLFGLLQQLSQVTLALSQKYGP